MDRIRIDYEEHAYFVTGERSNWKHLYFRYRKMPHAAAGGNSPSNCQDSAHVQETFGKAFTRMIVSLVIPR